MANPKYLILMKRAIGVSYFIFVFLCTANILKIRFKQFKAKLISEIKGLKKSQQNSAVASLTINVITEHMK